MEGTFIALSISHRRAPVEVREAVQLSEAESRALAERFPNVETLVLSTCNRTELYAKSLRETEIAPERMLECMFDLKQLSEPGRAEYRAYFETRYSDAAIRHLFAVIAGIDSQIIGDRQIFAQVKDAFRLSEEAHTSGAFLNKLSQAAYRVAKRVISETTIAEGAGTISYAAVEFARKIYDDFRSKRILVIGAGESAELAVKHFIEKRAGRLTIANRRVERAAEMIARIRAEYANAEIDIVPLEEIPTVLSTTDILLSATAAPEYIVTKAMMEIAMQQRESSAPMVLLDIAVPRDVEPTVGTLSNVFLKDIDDLRTIVDRNAAAKRAEIPKAEAIIEEELARFTSSLASLEAGPTIKALRDKFEAIRAEELERHRAKLDDRSFALLDDMTRRMMARLLHTPAITLKETDGDLLSRAEIVRKLFGLD